MRSGGSRRVLSGGLLGAPCRVRAAVAQPRAARDFPSRPVRFVIPPPPGGSPDILTRLLASLGAQRHSVLAFAPMDSDPASFRGAIERDLRRTTRIAERAGLQG